MTQARTYAPARTYLARRQQEGRTAREARRALKRHLVRASAEVAGLLAGITRVRAARSCLNGVGLG